MLYDLVSTDYPDRWELHKHGCKDVARLRKQSCAVHEIDGVSPADVIDHELSLNDGEYRAAGWTEKDFRIMPCCARPVH